MYTYIYIHIYIYRHAPQVDLSWPEIFDSMGMLGKMRERLAAPPPPQPDGQGVNTPVF